MLLPRIVMTLLVSHEADLVEANLAYHLARGVDFAVVTENRASPAVVEVILKYGKHFKGTIRAQITGARGAAEALGKAVRTQADSFEQFGYLWVQFADLSVRVGQPCRCGGTLSRLHPRHARCTACGASVIITGDLGMDLAANDAKERSEAPVQKDAQKGAQQSAQGATPSPENLQYYTDVRLFSYRQYAEMEVLAGSGKDPMGAEFLLIVSYPLSDGERAPIRAEQVHALDLA